jgi:TPR repeat protein
VFDYLVDHAQRAPETLPVPEPAWQGCLENADPGELVRIAIAAFSLQRPDIAEAALRQRASEGDAEAMNTLGNVLHRARRMQEAETWYRKAAEQGYPAAMTNLGALLGDEKRTAEAEAWYRRAVGFGDLAAMFNLGELREEAGDEAEAESWYLRAADGLRPKDREAARIGRREDARISIGQPMHTAATMAMTALASLYERQGRPDDAFAWYTKAADLDDPDAMTGLAAFLDNNGQPERAAKWRQRAAERGDRPKY